MKLIALPLAPYNTPHTRTAEDEGRSCHATCCKVIAFLRFCVPFLIYFNSIYHNVLYVFDPLIFLHFAARTKKSYIYKLLLLTNGQ